jgi:hypothetical protein
MFTSAINPEEVMFTEANGRGSDVYLSHQQTLEMSSFKNWCLLV